MTDVFGSEPEPGIVSVTWKSQGRQCPALRMGNTIAWLNRESQLVVEGVDRHHAAQRHFLLLDLGVKMAVPNEWVERGDPLWYVDLVIWEQHGERFDMRMSRVPWNFGGGPVSIRLRSRLDHCSRR